MRIIGAVIIRTLPWALLVLTAFIMNWPSPAWSGSFSVVPTTLHLDAKKQSEEIKLSNAGAEKVSVQIDPVEWIQDETGADRYLPTTDIIVFPLIVSIEPGSKQVIRVGHEGKSRNLEKAYRLFISELPISKSEQAELRFTLTLSVPLFIAPSKERRDVSIQGTELLEGTLRVQLRNNGNRHATVSRVTATGLTDKKDRLYTREASGWYVLPGVTRPFAVELPVDECLKTKTIEVNVQLESTALEAWVDVNERNCHRKQKP
jgi:fimbrial chaperone protein